MLISARPTFQAREYYNIYEQTIVERIWRDRYCFFSTAKYLYLLNK